MPEAHYLGVTCVFVFLVVLVLVFLFVLVVFDVLFVLVLVFVSETPCSLIAILSFFWSVPVLLVPVFPFVSLSDLVLVSVCGALSDPVEVLLVLVVCGARSTFLVFGFT